MLVITQNLVLAEVEDVPEDTPYIGYHNLVTFENLTATSSDADHPVTNLADVTTTPYWLATAATEQEVTAAINSVEDVDYVGIAGHNFGTEQIAVEVGYYDSSSPPAWVNLAGPQIPEDDQPIVLAFEAQSLADVVVKMAAGGGAPRMAVLYVGKLLVLNRGVIPEGDMPWLPESRKTTRVNGVSDAGQFLGSIILGAMIVWSLVFKYFEAAWFKTNFVPFLRACRDEGQPFFLAWKPVTYPYEVGYCWLTDDPAPMVNHPVDRRGIELSGQAIVS